MKNLTKLLLIALGATVLVSAANASDIKRQTRCGWIVNPTPGNVSLSDSIDKEDLLIGVQGGHQAEGDWTNEVPDDQFVEINGSYGYYCGCIDADINLKESLVLKIHNTNTKLLKDCLKDPNVPSLK